MNGKSCAIAKLHAQLNGIAMDAADWWINRVWIVNYTNGPIRDENSEPAPTDVVGKISEMMRKGIGPRPIANEETKR